MNLTLFKKATPLWLLIAMSMPLVAVAQDQDNNPPGAKGGPGTNWENPKGPEGGPGASPNQRYDKADRNHDGTVDDTEKARAQEILENRRDNRDPDNNPPGPRGGEGTNWENPPGAEGGAGASPNAKPPLGEKADLNNDGTVDDFEKRKAIQHRQHNGHRDQDNNPPGPKGGEGSNWENRPGPQGGPGAGPDRRHDHDNNPPGAKGGAGTNWENPKGPAGGPGASPNRHPNGGGGGNPPGPRGGPGGGGRR